MGLFGGTTTAMSSGASDTGISDLTVGISKSGMEAYIQQLKADLLDTSVEKINDTSNMLNAINSGWQGASRDNFISDFNAAREAIANDLIAEYNDLAARLQELQDNYFKQDSELYEKL